MEQRQTTVRPESLTIKLDLPPISIPLPRGNFVEIRLKRRLRGAGEFDTFKAILDAMKSGLMEIEAED